MRRNAVVIMGVVGVLAGAAIGLIGTGTEAGDRPRPGAGRAAGPAPGNSGAGPTAPRFVVPAKPAPALQTNPSQPDYDPTRFKGIVKLSDVYQREPRNESWAGTVESHLTRGLGADLAKVLPGVTIEPVECRSTMCRVAWRGPGEEERKVIQAIQVLYPPEGMGFGPNQELFLAYKGSHWYPEVGLGNSSELLKGMHVARQKQLTAIREGSKMAQLHGRSMPDDGIPAHAWPEQ